MHNRAPIRGHRIRTSTRATSPATTTRSSRQSATSRATARPIADPIRVSPSTTSGAAPTTKRMELGAHEREILSELRTINARLEWQNSLLHMLWSGLVYGIGFVIGSAILATIIIGIFGPIVARIPLVDSAFSQGKSILQRP